MKKPSFKYFLAISSRSDTISTSFIKDVVNDIPILAIHRQSIAISIILVVSNTSTGLVQMLNQTSLNHNCFYLRIRNQNKLQNQYKKPNNLPYLVRFGSLGILDQISSNKAFRLTTLLLQILKVSLHLCANVVIFQHYELKLFIILSKLGKNLNIITVAYPAPKNGFIIPK